MSYASITAIGVAQEQQVVVTFWYDLPWVTADLTTANQDVLLDLWETAIRAPLLAWHTTSYRMRKESCVFYDANWVRTPYLPRERDMDIAGGRNLMPAPPIVASVLSARVEPVVSAPRRDTPTTFKYTPVRRGYLALGPLSEDDYDHTGVIAAATIASAPWVNMRNAFATGLQNAGMAGPARPIRVSPEEEDANPRRGYGNVLSAVWRAELTSRRSRKRGVGA